MRAALFVVGCIFGVAASQKAMTLGNADKDGYSLQPLSQTEKRLLFGTGALPDSMSSKASETLALVPSMYEPVGTNLPATGASLEVPV